MKGSETCVVISSQKQKKRISKPKETYGGQFHNARALEIEEFHVRRKRAIRGGKMKREMKEVSVVYEWSKVRHKSLCAQER